MTAAEALVSEGQTVDGPGVVRPLTDSGFHAVEHLRMSGMLDGSATLISVSLIATKLGDRWALRRDAIHEYVKRAIVRYIGADGSAMRVSDTDYLVVQPHLTRIAAQARCLCCLSDVLAYFLGQAPMGDLDVHEITAISERGLEVAPIDRAAVQAAQAREKTGTPPEAGAPVDRWSPFVASNGKRVRVSCKLEPVFELKGYGRIGYRLARRVLVPPDDEPLSAAEHSRLTRSDMERIDFATIARGLGRLSSEVGDGGARELSLIIPVSYISLSNQHGRKVLIDLFKEAQQAVRRGVICEVCDIDGVPQAALLAATSLIKPYSLFVVGRTAGPPDRATAQLRGTGLQAIAFEAPDAVAEDDAMFCSKIMTAVAAAKSVAKSVMIYGLSDSRRVAMAASLGATHASIRAQA